MVQHEKMLLILLLLNAEGMREWSISSLVMSSSQQPPATHPFPTTLWWTNSLLLKIAIEIADVPIKHGDFP